MRLLNLTHYSVNPIQIGGGDGLKLPKHNKMPSKLKKLKRNSGKQLQILPSKALYNCNIQLNYILLTTFIIIDDFLI